MKGLTEWRRNRHTTPISTTTRSEIARLGRKLGPPTARWLDATELATGNAGHVLLPAANGKLERVVTIANGDNPVWNLAELPYALPQGDYALDPDNEPPSRQLAILGWALGAYRFDRYRAAGRVPARLAVRRNELAEVRPLVEAVSLVRDLVNTPTADLGPAELAASVRALAKAHKGRFRQWVGPELLRSGFPAIHAVGRAASTAPRLIELNWGKRDAPRVSLIGKGVCFDTGGLDLKSASGMRWMKKDMGGSAHAIALAGLVMQAGLPVRLQLLIPAVDNAVSGNAYRPGEVLDTRLGLKVEVDNTDAEGRLVLCDALAYAGESNPELMLDFATLTGAARVALGSDLPALFANDDGLAEALLAASREQHDPLWRMPLHAPYQSMLDSHIADCTNSASSRHAGAITAALYLQKFVPANTPWAHFDTYAWNDRDRPGRPKGGEALGLRAVFAMLKSRYGG